MRSENSLNNYDFFPIHVLSFSVKPESNLYLLRNLLSDVLREVACAVINVCVIYEISWDGNAKAAVAVVVAAAADILRLFTYLDSFK